MTARAAADLVNNRHCAAQTVHTTGVRSSENAKRKEKLHRLPCQQVAAPCKVAQQA